MIEYQILILSEFISLVRGLDIHIRLLEGYGIDPVLQTIVFEHSNHERYFGMKSAQLFRYTIFYFFFFFKWMSNFLKPTGWISIFLERLVENKCGSFPHIHRIRRKLFKKWQIMPFMGTTFLFLLHWNFGLNPCNWDFLPFGVNVLNPWVLRIPLTNKRFGSNSSHTQKRILFSSLYSMFSNWFRIPFWNKELLKVCV